MFLSACSKRERTAADDAEWADVQPIASKAGEAVPGATPAPGSNRRVVQSEGEDYAPLIQRMAEMESVVRAAGETLITGEGLVLDYERRYVRMDHDVKVVDDRGELATEVLTGRFSASNQVEFIEASKGVLITSEGRVATAQNATYAFQSGSVQLDGMAKISGADNILSGERIQFWIKGNRRMVCEPNAMLHLSNAGGLAMEGVPAAAGGVDIRSNRVVYDEEHGRVEFDGNVRVRDPRVAMNCANVVLHLKENNEIDWIEAQTDVIIQSDARKALADRATYHADDGRFVLEGDPKVKQGKSIMTGDRIVFWKDTQRMVCEPNARVLLYPDEKLTAKFRKDLKD